MRGSGDSFTVEIVWHWRETSQQTEKTNLNLTLMSLTLLYREKRKGDRFSSYNKIYPI
jgi:hypothetical protein